MLRTFLFEERSMHSVVDQRTLIDGLPLPSHGYRMALVSAHSQSPSRAPQSIFYYFLTKYDFKRGHH